MHDPARASSQMFELREPTVIERWARADAALHIYEIGDLDPFFWPHTQWFGLGEPERPKAVAMLYTGARVPTLLALSRDASPALHELVTQLCPRLPDSLYAHLGPALLDALGPGWHVEHHGHHLKMVLRAPEQLAAVDTGALELLDRSMLDELLEFYAHSYPGNWFDARMLDTRQYLGLREHGRLACVAGVHVYSPQYGVAALGNVTTAPEQRGRGLARRVVAGLCRRLLDHGVETIGLNVHGGNAAAIACYRRLGFETLAGYDEAMLTRR